MGPSVSRRSVVQLVIVLSLAVTGLGLRLLRSTKPNTFVAIVPETPADKVVSDPREEVLRSDAGDREVTVLEHGEVAASELRTVVEPVETGPSPITGHVQWPDGRPGADCIVDCAFLAPLGKGKTLSNWSFECDPTGAFRTREFSYGTVASLTARNRRAEEQDASLGDWVAHVENVSPGTKDLILVLGSGLTLRATILDDEGRVQDRTKVRACHSAWGLQTCIEAVAGRFDESNGSFELTGLYAGEWNLTADRPGYWKVVIPVTLRRDDSPLRIVLRPFAILTGVLVDDSDRPIPDARVTAGVRRKGAIESTSSFSSGIGLDGQARSDTEGRFQLPVETPGTVVLSASAEGRNLAGTLELDLGPGEFRHGLKVVLHPAGRPPQK